MIFYSKINFFLKGDKGDTGNQGVPGAPGCFFELFKYNDFLF